MKKFQFIIPIESILRLTCAFLLFFLALNCTTVYAVDFYGCHVLAGSTQRIYLTEISPYNHTKFTGSGISGLAGYTDQSGTECLDDLGPACTVYYGDGAGGTTSTIYKSGFYGHLYNNCPIDDFVPFMIIFVVAIGFSQIRKSAVIKISNESKYNHSCL